jgi:hypothetical protein
MEDRRIGRLMEEAKGLSEELWDVFLKKSRSMKGRKERAR